MRWMKKHTKGFTLMEILVSIAMVGILFVPLMTFFSSSLKTNTQAKNMQRVNTLAQQVMEEVRGYDSIAEMCLTADNSGNLIRTVSENSTQPYTDPDSNMIYTDSTQTAFKNDKYYFLLKNLESDGKKYEARIVVDASKYATSAIQDVPVIASLGSDSTIMSVESDETKQVLNTYQRRNAEVSGSTMSIAELAQHLRKTIKVNVTVTALDNGMETIPTDMVRIQIYNVYSMDSSIAGCSENIISDRIYNEEVAYKNLKGIYLFYSYDIYDNQDILNGIDYTVSYQNHPDWDANYTFYAICQRVFNFDDGEGHAFTEAEMEDYGKSHAVKFTCKLNGVVQGASSAKLPVFSNFSYKLDNGSGSTEYGTAKQMSDIVATKPVQRLADVTVKVYEKGNNKPLITLESTRGE